MPLKINKLNEVKTGLQQHHLHYRLIIGGFLTVILVVGSFELKAQGLTSSGFLQIESLALHQKYDALNIEDSSAVSINRKRLNGVILAEASLFAGSMYGLYHLWYKDYPQSSFHFHNDNRAWLQMDKIGHGITSYYVGKFGYEMLRWSGVPEKDAIWYGGPLGFVYLLSIETLDGFSTEWGASAGDLIANTTGAALFMGQQALWKEQRISFKYSFHQTKYAKYRPDLFGSQLSENFLKDYNGQTLWASVNLKSFIDNPSSIPDWLNVAIGYSAEGMTGANTNVREHNGNSIPYFPRYRQYFLSLDVDLTKIKTDSDFLKNLFSVVGFIKIPFPALEYNTNQQWKFHWFYF